MYRHILIATDGSELAAKALDHGLRLAHAVGARVTALTVREPFRLMPRSPSQAGESARSLGERAHGQAEAALADAVDQARAAGVECETLSVEHDAPHTAIIDTAHITGCDLIVMASRGRGGLSAMVLGSQTMKVLTRSDIPVLVLR